MLSFKSDQPIISVVISSFSSFTTDYLRHLSVGEGYRRDRVDRHSFPQLLHLMFSKMSRDKAGLGFVDYYKPLVSMVHLNALFNYGLASTYNRVTNAVTPPGLEFVVCNTMG